MLIVIAHEIDGSLRFCMDHRKLNAGTVKDRYPIPQMDMFIDGFWTANVFSALDANGAYSRIELDKDDSDESVFINHNKLYR